jgi:signal transduction histidine kinase
MAQVSLAARLVAGAALLSSLALAATGWGLSALYRDAVQRGLDAELSVVVDGVTSGVRAERQGALDMPLPLADPRFSRPLSGRFWAIYDDDGSQPELRSRSLWDEAPPVSPDLRKAALADPGATQFDTATGPEGAPYRLAVRSVRLETRDQPILIVAGADRRPVDRDADRFAWTVAAALAALAVGLILAVLIQVRVGLAPVRQMQAGLAAIRSGARDRLDEEAPSELAPLARELNALLRHNQEVVERARTHVGNLAHALKTPIAVLVNEGRATGGPLGELVERQATTMSRQVDHHLKRAAAAARAEALGARTPVRQVIEDIVRMLSRLHGRRGVAISADVSGDPVFRGEREDFEEMIGNLAENACKYGGGAVRVAASAGPDGLLVAVDDDGPGLSDAERVEALKRGRRLDQSAPGSGLGLDIARDIAEAYGGRLLLSESSLGGLKAELLLPMTSAT